MMVEHESSADVMQDQEPELATVPVRVEGQVLVQQLPARGGTIPVTQTIGRSTPIRVLGHDPMRLSATVMALDYDVYLSTTQAGCSAVTGAKWTKGIPVSWPGCNELWLLGADANADSVVTVVATRWAE